MFCFVFKFLWRKEERGGGEREREGENGDRILEMRTVHKGEFPLVTGVLFKSKIKFSNSNKTPPPLPKPVKVKLHSYKNFRTQQRYSICTSNHKPGVKFLMSMSDCYPQKQ